MKRVLLLAAVLSATALSQAAAVETAPGAQSAAKDVEDFARSISSTARTAEIAAPASDARQVQRRVASGVEEVIVTAGKPPTTVRLALQRVVFVCTRPAEIQSSGYSCPGTDAGMQGLRDVLATVTALVEGSETAALDSVSGPPLQAPPTLQAGGGGPDYQQVQ